MNIALYTGLVEHVIAINCNTVLCFKELLCILEKKGYLNKNKSSNDYLNEFSSYGENTCITINLYDAIEINSINYYKNNSYHIVSWNEFLDESNELLLDFNEILKFPIGSKFHVYDNSCDEKFNLLDFDVYWDKDNANSNHKILKCNDNEVPLGTYIVQCKFSQVPCFINDVFNFTVGSIFKKSNSLDIFELQERDGIKILTLDGEYINLDENIFKSTFKYIEI